MHQKVFTYKNLLSCDNHDVQHVTSADVLVTSLAASNIASHSACYVFAIQQSCGDMRHDDSFTYALPEGTTCNVTASIDDVRTGDVINEFHSATTCCPTKHVDVIRGSEKS